MVTLQRLPVFMKIMTIIFNLKNLLLAQIPIIMVFMLLVPITSLHSNHVQLIVIQSELSLTEVMESIYTITITAAKLREALSTIMS